MSISAMEVNESLSKFYAGLSKPPPKCVLSTPPSVLQTEFVMYRCSLAYRLLLNRYPDLESNLSIPQTKCYFSRKLSEIYKSLEYSKIDNKRWILYSDSTRLLKVYGSPSVVLLAISLYNLTPQNNLHTLCDPLLLVKLAIYFAQNKIYPEEVAILYNQFFVLKAKDNSDSKYSLKDIYLSLRAEWLAYTLNDFNHARILKNHCPFLPNSFEFQMLSENFASRRLLSSSELCVRGFNTLPPCVEYPAKDSQSAYCLVSWNELREHQIHGTLIIHDLGSGDELYEPESIIFKNEWCQVCRYNFVDVKSFFGALEKSYTSDIYINFVFYRELVVPVLSKDEKEKSNTQLLSVENTAVQLERAIEWAQISAEYISRNSPETTYDSKLHNVFENTVKLMGLHTSRLCEMYYLKNRFAYLCHLVRDPAVLIQMTYQSILGRVAEPSTITARKMVYLDELLKVGGAHSKSSFLYDLVHELMHSKEYNDNLGIDSTIWNQIMAVSLCSPPAQQTAKDAQGKLRIKYYGCFGTSGYAICCKLIVWALHMQDVDIQFVMLESYHQSSVLNDYDRLLLRLSVNVLPQYDLVVVHSVPSQWDKIRIYEKSKNSDMKVYGITVWETERIPKPWIDPMNKVDWISCPCDYNKTVFELDVSSVPVETVHHPIIVLSDGTTDKQHMQSIFKEHNVTEDTYKFYTINEYNGRKGISDLLRIYAETFEYDQDVFLYVKTSCHQSKEEIAAYLERLQMALNKKLPKLFVDIVILSEQQITAVHEMNDCYVSLTKGEGTGYTSCQAALLGKPIIISRYSATPEYIKFAHFVDVEIQSAIYCDRVFSKHRNCTNRCVFNPNYDSNIQKWGVPIASQVREKMQHCFEQRIRRGFAETTDFIKQEFSLEAVGKKFVASLKSAIESSQLSLLPSCNATSVSEEAGSVISENVTVNKNEKYVIPTIFKNIFKDKILLDEKGLCSVSLVYE
jgi:glycosyltransferase involved in cell wall biosynthesis